MTAGPSRTRRSVWIALAGTVVFALVAVGGLVVWSRADAARQQRLAAARVAAALSAGKLDDAAFAASDPAPSAAYASIIKNMRGLTPSVGVQTIIERSEAEAEAVLTYSWPIPSRDPWTYPVTLPLRRIATGWVGVWSPSLVAPGLSGEDRLVYNRLPAARGEVLGADGKLAFNQPAIWVGIDKTRLVPSAWDIGARTLAETLTKAGVALDADAYAAKVRAAGSQASVEAAVLRTLDPVQDAAAKKVATLGGVHTRMVTRSLGLTSGLLRPVLGQVGDATAEIVAASNGQVVASDQVGTAGLQRSYDERLRGTPGYAVQVLVKDGEARDLVRVGPIDGQDVRTTIDIGLQKAAEKILATVRPASAIVAIRPSDGAVLTVASGPGSAGVASTATQALYEPGSTFKTVTGLAMLRHGLTPTSTLPCTASITVDGYRFGNDLGYPNSALGNVPWTSAFAHSCNTAVISQADTVSQQDLVSSAQALGLLGGGSIGVPVTASRVPADAGTTTGHAASMIGQGTVLATPFGMATVTASIVKGDLVRPVLVTSPGRPTPADPAGLIPVDAAEARALRTLMRGVVTGGTATSALAGTPGKSIIAKTGTSTYVVDGEKRYHTWLIAGQGDLAVAVMVADGDYGAGTCGPLLKQFLTAVND